jgi:hypothetical protein
LRKIVIIFIIAIALSGCAATKNRSAISPVSLSGNIIENTKYQNISNNSFFIEKAEIELLTDEGKEKFVGTIKFEKPDKYLISLKSRTGIEGARIYITKDTILINDRINKKLYSGTAAYLNHKYGISVNLLPLIFGDVFLDSKCDKKEVICSGEKASIDCSIKGTLIKYEIDCKRSKTGAVSLGEEDINLKFDKYFVLSNILVPRTVEFRANKYKMSINIRIVKVEYPWNGNISFVPGKGYELIELR